MGTRGEGKRHLLLPSLTSSVLICHCVHVCALSLSLSLSLCIRQVNHLETTGSALAEDVMQKSEIIKTYFMENKAGQ